MSSVLRLLVAFAAVCLICWAAVSAATASAGVRSSSPDQDAFGLVGPTTDARGPLSTSSPESGSAPAPDADFPSAPQTPTGVASGSNAARVDDAWAVTLSVRTGIPERAVRGYAGAAIALASEHPTCRIGWNTLAAIGDIESAHGTHGGSQLDQAGVDRPGVFGPALDGGSAAAVADSDGGAMDGDEAVDRAVGPLQFIPSTWQQWGADGNGDGVLDPQQIDDAALAAGRYLCSYGDLSAPAAWRTAVFAYNHLDSYVDSVAEVANRYAAEAG